MPSRSAPGIKAIRRGGIYPSRTPAATGTPRFSVGHKIRPNQAPLSKGAGCGQSPQTGGLSPGKMPPTGGRTAGDCLPAKCRPRQPRPNAHPPVNGISRRNNPSALASLGHLPLTREAKRPRRLAASRNHAGHKKTPPRGRGRAGAGDSGLAQNHSALELFFKITSWLPPSTMEVEDTTVSRAFSCSSGMVSAPQLHMVDFTLYSVVCTPSASGPA